jgi:hypothetical protein
VRPFNAGYPEGPRCQRLPHLFDGIQPCSMSIRTVSRSIRSRLLPIRAQRVGDSECPNVPASHPAGRLAHLRSDSDRLADASEEVAVHFVPLKRATTALPSPSALRWSNLRVS